MDLQRLLYGRWDFFRRLFKLGVQDAKTRWSTTQYCPDSPRMASRHGAGYLINRIDRLLKSLPAEALESLDAEATLALRRSRGGMQ